MEFFIPKQFQLFGHTISVVEYTGPLKDHCEFDGLWDMKNKKITLVKDKTSQGYKEAVYLHEVVHCILDHIGKEDLSKDEDFVDTFAQALHQILTTSK